MKPDVRRVLLEWASGLQDPACSVLLSGGVDSAAIVFALLEVNKIVHAYSFTLDDRESTDFLQARALCRTFGIRFTAVRLPTAISVLQQDMTHLRDIGAVSKTDYECAWPMLYAYRATDTRYVASGMGADGHFCISKKGMIHWRSRIDEFRRNLFASPRYAQQQLHYRIAEMHDRKAELPFLSKGMQHEFAGTTWEQVNTPRQKNPILQAFPSQFRKVRVRPHTNLQLGDSGIAMHCTRLLHTSWNIGNKKSVVSIYNALNRNAL